MQPGVRGARVLIADDERLSRTAMGRLLRLDGHEVVEASDGPGALQAFRRYQPDVLLLDARMPGCDGFEVCRELKRDPATALTPVVMISGLGALEDRVRGLDAGADDFFTKPVAGAELRSRVRSALRTKHLADELEAAEAVLFALARAIEGKDPATEGHCERLSGLAERLAARLGLPLEDRVALRRAGIVHDIGKVAVPDAILLKRGPLDPSEWAVMREHAAAGERICAPMKSMQRILPIVRHHHERQDGSGYPDGLVGNAIPVTARVLQVVDVFDALTMERPYKAPMSSAAAFGVLEGEVVRGWWDPVVFEAFKAMMGENGEDRWHAC